MEETTLHNDGSSAVRNIALEKEGEKKVIATGGIRIWSPTQVLISPNRTLALLNRRIMLLSFWYSDSLIFIFL